MTTRHEKLLEAFRKLRKFSATVGALEGTTVLKRIFADFGNLDVHTTLRYVLILI